MKKIWIVFLCFILILSIVPGVCAKTPKVIDDANLLSDEEVAQLEKTAQGLVNTYNIDVVIYTVWSMDGKDPERFADDFYDENGYGVGSNNSGILFMLSMEYRDWAISTCGDAIYAVNDYANQELFSCMAPALSEGNYYEAFTSFLSNLEIFFRAYAQGDPIDGTTGEYTGPGTFVPGTQESIVHYERKRTPGDYLRRFLVALLIGSVVGGITVLIMKGRMNTVRSQSGAFSYAKDGVHINTSLDMFLTSHITSTLKDTSPPHSGGGGGSSVHHSSSGASHGGSHGKF